MLRKSILTVLSIAIAILMLCSCDGSEEIQETSKPEQRPMSQGEAERDYYIFASTQMKKLSECLETISVACKTDNKYALSGGIEKMRQIKRDLKQRGTPIFFVNFKNKTVKVVEEWEKAYICMQDRDDSGVKEHTEKAAKLLDEVVKEYDFKNKKENEK
jgi:general stress protein 26